MVTHEKSFKSQVDRVRYMREDFTNQLNLATGFWQISIVNNQAAWISIILLAIVLNFTD